MFETFFDLREVKGALLETLRSNQAFPDNRGCCYSDVYGGTHCSFYNLSGKHFEQKNLPFGNISEKKLLMD